MFKTVKPMEIATAQPTEEMARPGKSRAATRRIKALMSSEKRPMVMAVIGRVSLTMTGRTKALRRAMTATATSAARGLVMVRPKPNQAKINKEADSMSQVIKMRRRRLGEELFAMRVL